MKSPLDLAKEAVHGDRRLDYGTPEQNHTRTAALWSAYLGVPVNAGDVCMLNILQKVSRERHARKMDNLTDIAGYAENAFLVGPFNGTPAELPERTAAELAAAAELRAIQLHVGAAEEVARFTGCANGLDAYVCYVHNEIESAIGLLLRGRRG